MSVKTGSSRDQTVQGLDLGQISEFERAFLATAGRVGIVVFDNIDASSEQISAVNIGANQPFAVVFDSALLPAVLRLPDRQARTDRIQYC